jgi:hypothetical protein
MGVALIAGCLAPGSVLAQPYAPSPVGAARMPEPIPCAPVPNVVPGPLTAAQAPPGPPDCLSLPEGHSSAFQCENYAVDCNFYATLGGIGLRRQRLGNLPIATLDPQNRDIGAASFFIQPLRFQQVIQNANELSSGYEWGPTGTVGFLMPEGHAFELSGFYLPAETRNNDRAINGRINVFNTGNVFGFSGDNGLFLQADRDRVSQTTGLWGAQVNYRYSNIGIEQAELILGVRYTNFSESFSVFTDDDGLTFQDNLGRPDPRRQATQKTNAQNQLLAPQVGAEYGFLVRPWLSVGGTGHIAPGVNFLRTNNTLVRGDGFIGVIGTRDQTIFSQLYDISFWFDVHLTERARVRAAYTAMWLLQIQTAESMYDYNSANTFGRMDHNGSVFFHGPSVEFQFLF